MRCDDTSAETCLEKDASEQDTRGQTVMREEGVCGSRALILTSVQTTLYTALRHDMRSTTRSAYEITIPRACGRGGAGNVRLESLYSKPFKIKSLKRIIRNLKLNRANP